MDCYDDDSWADGYAEGKIEVLEELLAPIRHRLLDLQASGIDHPSMTSLIDMVDRWNVLYEHTRGRD
jgi:hypothetical protein